jgi:hypothetical protein
MGEVRPIIRSHMPDSEDTDHVDASTRQLAFMPWLRLKNSQSIGGVEFVPLRDAAGETAPVLLEATDALTRILSGYIDRTGSPVDNCVVATIPGQGWDLSMDDFAKVQWAASLLFVAAWACNDYFPRWIGSYENSSSFRVIWQRFLLPPSYIGITSRRRDVRSCEIYRHGGAKFSAPVQCSLRDPATVDEGMLDSLDKGDRANCETMGRLRYAIPFVSLANTDDDLMTENAEAILMGSAFEQLLCGDASAYELGRKFGDLFGSFGSVTVKKAKENRPGIEIDESTPERAAAQPEWWVHRKWVEELYNLRSKSVHEGTATGWQWGWTPSEHLIMAAWVFPLAVKLLLQRDGYYALSDDDRYRCLAIDKLLAVTAWGEKTKGGVGPHRWREIVDSKAN